MADETSNEEKLRVYVAAAAAGLAVNAVSHNMNGDQVAERAFEIGKRLLAWDINGGAEPPPPPGARR